MYILARLSRKTQGNKKVLSAKNLLVGAVFLATTLGIWSIPTASVEAAPKVEQIAQKITTLRKSNKRWIEIDLQAQRLFAWEGGERVYEAVISSGKATTPTIPGVFNIQSKQVSQRMRGRDYDIPNVPYAMFYSGNYAIHGAFWHNNFGTPVSHGCTNMQVYDAEWIYKWASIGTPVVIHN